MLRSALGAVVAVGLVAGGIVALQALVPERHHGPAGQGPVVISTPPVSPSHVPTVSPSPTPVATTATTTRPPLTVLNNSRVTGLAKKAAADFAAGGWTIAATGNLHGRTAVTTAYYAPGQRAAADALRAQFPAIAAVAPRFAGLPGHGLTVVVTRDYPH